MIALAFSLCTYTHYVTNLCLILLVTLLLCVSSGVAATILACVATICVEYCQYKVGKYIPDVCGQLLCIKSLWAGLILRNIGMHSNSLSFAEMVMTKLAGIIPDVREWPVFIMMVRCIVFEWWSSEGAGAHSLVFRIALLVIHIKISSWYQNGSSDHPQWAYLLIAGVEMPHVILSTK